MSNAFLSYAREDLKFVRRLKDALEARGLETWVDLEGLYAGEEYKSRILAAIEAAEAFVFVLSPSSAASVFCHEEVQYAVAQNKRIVPVLLEEPAEAIPAAVASRQWTFMRPDDDFEAAVGSLARTLETDPAHVRAHTRLLVRSREWERSEREPSLLLRGSELDRAEAWLTEAGAHDEPKPVSIQIEFVQSGRRRERHRQRLVLGGVSVALVVALILAAVAFWQRQLKERQRVQAVSRELAANSVARLEDDPELSLLLAREALGVSRTEQAEDALRQALLRSHLQRAFRGHSRRMTSAEFSPDGARLLTAAVDGRTLMWEVETGARLLEFSGARAAFSPDGHLVATVGGAGGRLWDATSGEPLANLPGDLDAPVGDLAFSPDGSLLAAGDRAGRTRLWRVPSGEPVGDPLPHTGHVTRLRFGPNGRHLAVCGFYSRTRVWDVESATMVRELDGYHVAFDPDGTRLVTGGASGALNFLSIASGEPPIEVEGHDGPISSIEFSADGASLVSAGYDKTVKVWQWAKPEPDRVLIGHTDWVLDAAFSPDGAYVVSAGVDRVGRLWQLSTGMTVAELRGHGDRVNSVLFDPDGERMLTAADDGVARIWKVAVGVPRLTLAGHEYTVEALAFSADSALLATGSEDATVRLWDTASGAPSGPPLEHQEGVTGIAFLPGGQSLVTSDISGRIRTWDLNSRELIGPTLELELELYDVAVSPDGRLLGAGSNGGAYLFDFAARDPGLALPQEDLVVDVDFSPDGRLFATAGYDKTARVWLTGTREPAGQALVHDAFVDSVEFSADGRWLLTASGDEARIWEVPDGRLVARLRGHVGELYTAVFSPDDRYVLTSSQDYTTRLWDVQSARTVLQLRGQTNAIYSAIFSPDGRWIATGSEDATTHVYDCEVCRPLDEMLEVANRRLTRELTPEERLRYLED